MHLSFIFDGPAFLESSSEVGIEGELVVVRVEHEKVVDVAGYDESLFARPTWRLYCFPLAEDARVSFVRGEAVVLEPWEERALPAATCLCHPVDWFEHAAHTGLAVATDARIALRVHLFVPRGGRQ